MKAGLEALDREALRIRRRLVDADDPESRRALARSIGSERDDIADPNVSALDELTRQQDFRDARSLRRVLLDPSGPGDRYPDGEASNRNEGEKACRAAHAFAAYTTFAANSFFSSPYSRLSTSACRLASMMFSLTPMVVQLDTPSLDSMSTLVRAAVPTDESTMRTL